MSRRSTATLADDLHPIATEAWGYMLPVISIFERRLISGPDYMGCCAHRLILNIPKYQVGGDVSLVAWSTVHARNACKTAIREWRRIGPEHRKDVDISKIPKVNYYSEFDTDGGRPFDAGASSDDIEVSDFVRHVFDTLTNYAGYRDAEIMRLLYLERMKYREVAEITGLTMGGVQYIDEKCIKFLRSKLQNYFLS